MFFLFLRLERPAGWICARYKFVLLLLLNSKHHFYSVLYIKKFPNINDISLHMGVRIGGWGCTIISNTQYQKQNCTGTGVTNITNINNWFSAIILFIVKDINQKKSKVTKIIVLKIVD